MNMRAMNAADIPAVLEIDQLSFSQPWPPDAFNQELQNGNAHCSIAEIEGRVVAVLVIWRVLDEAHIATIAVHPDCRQHGIGKALLQAGMQDALADGARMYYLEVRAGNLWAQKMYTDLGFKVVNRRLKYYKNNGEDALLMSLILSKTGDKPDES